MPISSQTLQTISLMLKCAGVGQKANTASQSRNGFTNGEGWQGGKLFSPLCRFPLAKVEIPPHKGGHRDKEKRNEHRRPD